MGAGSHARSAAAGLPACKQRARAPGLAARLKVVEGGPRGGGAGVGHKGNAAVRTSAFGAAFAGVNVPSGEATQSRYQTEAQAEEDGALDDMMTALERKDAAASKMDAITVQKVKAWACTQCSYTAEYPAPSCRAQGHEVRRVTASKRWWRCCGCSHHFSTVGVMQPKNRCPKCDSSDTGFKAASMLRGAKGPDQQAFASREKFLARGTEHAFTVTSLA